MWPISIVRRDESAGVVERLVSERRRGSAKQRIWYFAAVLVLLCANAIEAAHDFRMPYVSNVLRTLSSGLAMWLCVRQAILTSDRYFRRLWQQLGFGFGMWASAQVYFLEALIRSGHGPLSPYWNDGLWLSIAFPLLLVTASGSPDAKREWISWVDRAQAMIFFVLLYGLAFLKCPVVSTGAIYLVQSVALVFMCALRYLEAGLGQERSFFRNLGSYLTISACCSALCLLLGAHHWDRPGAVDFCWDLPLLWFCLITLSASSQEERSRSGKSWGMELTTHFGGFSALGMAIFSILAALELTLHRPRLGASAVVVAFVLFVIRTSARDAQITLAQASLRYAALHDSLTGLGNRERLRRELGRQLAISPQTTGLLFLDLDRFKMINDALGHQAGDQLLQMVAGRLRSTVRVQDLVCRLGGDEFVVLLRGTTPSEARTIADRMLAHLREPVDIAARTLRTTGSVGMIFGSPERSADDLLRDADCAMYRAKKLGRDRIQSFETSMDGEVNRELVFEQDLRECLENRNLEVWYQPIYSLREKRILGFEALVRWNHPVRGMILPGEFIPLAEERGLIAELGRQVLHEACRQMAEWNRRWSSNLTVSVNVSAQQCIGENLIGEIRETLLATSLPSKNLHLEITETVLMRGIKGAEPLLNEVRALGIEISLDDFGTGYSSLSYLLDLPFDTVKVDRKFVQKMDLDSRRAELMRTLVQLGRNLKKRVIVEGVETQAECNFLAELGCDLIQGYWFSKPLKPAEVELLFEEQGSRPVSTKAFLEGAVPEDAWAQLLRA